MKILIVDDDGDIREVLGLILRSEGFQVEEAADGLDALALLKESRPELILLDLMLPRLDGEGLVRALAGDPELSTVPICVISGHPAARDRAFRMGAFSCLVKPVDLDELTSLIERVAAR